ncbi:MAG: hypothetical protein KGJ84_00845 [Elusimicrobia bacterium]|nr:hypothetical protein [Elusimicrobiota bacterium]
MNAWILAALFCARATAAVVEPAVVAAPGASASGSAAAAAAGAAMSPVLNIPPASVLAPSLNTAAILKAFPDHPAPVALAPAAPAASAAPVSRAEAAPDASPAPAESVPPKPSFGRRGTPATAAVNALAARLEKAASDHEQTRSEAGPIAPLPAESADALGRRMFDRAAERALLADTAFAPNGGAAADAAATSRSADASRGAESAPMSAYAGEDGPLRDAVAASPSPSAFLFRAVPPSAAGAAPSPFAAGTRSPAAASALPVGSAPAPAQAPSFERLSLELGSGLVVKVRSALHLGPPVAPKPFVAGADSAAPALAFSRAPSRAPLTSTEWLERRGLLESLSASEAAADQTAAAERPGAMRPPSPSRLSVPARRSSVPSPALWALAFLPAAAILLKKLS